MKILLIGSGGREHALAHTFARQGHQVYALPGNVGMESICESTPKDWNRLDTKDFSSLANFVEKIGVDLTVVGPEVPLAQGIADAFEARALSLFGPSHQAAILETSKVWAKEFMQVNDIPTGRSVFCDTPQEARTAVATHFSQWGGVVIKPTGLTAGKGVTVCHTEDEAEEAIRVIMEESTYGLSGEEVVIEELLKGKELSILAFCDGKTIVPMIPSQDHKALYENNTGPNTGGIGAYTPVPFVGEEVMQEIQETIIKRTQRGLQQEPFTYRGVIYFGMMLTDEGPKVLEYNCRFGDPETQVVIPLIKTDLAQVMLACCKGRLEEMNIEWNKKASCCVVITSGGYPGVFEVGYPIKGLDHQDPDVVVFHAGTRKNDEGNFVTAGGRVLGVTAFGDSLEEAVEKAYDSVGKIHFHNAYYRKDIAYQAIGRTTAV